MLVVIALGGNALLRRGERMEASVQRTNAKVAAEAVAEVARRHQVVVTHGNGPQVGLLAVQSASDPDVGPYPLDILDAETEGMVGYILEQELGHHLPPDRIATLLTQIVVSPDDPAFANPTKPVGAVYPLDRLDTIVAEHPDWVLAPDGDGVRRVVPSPDPKGIVEIGTIRLLVERGVTVICSGGGGIPVVPGAGGLEGVEAVIDKDLSAALLATAVGADALLLLTDVDGVYRSWGTPEATLVSHASAAELRALDLPAGSMRPKIEAICRFVEDSGGTVGGIGSLADAVDILAGRAGTTVGPTRG